jgi:putative hydrolase of the HAD superfamily
VDAALLDLYDTAVRSHWGRLSEGIAEGIGITTAQLFQGYERTRSARAVGTFGSREGDMRAVIEASGAEATPELLERLLALEEDFAGWGVELWEDTVPVVSELRRRGVRTALVSNCSHATRPIVDRLGLGDVFDEVLLSFEVRAHKPDPEIYLEGLRRLGGIAPERAVFVDDQATYCDGAAAVGLDPYLIVRNDDIPARFDGHRVIRDLRALLVL